MPASDVHTERTDGNVGWPRWNLYWWRPPVGPHQAAQVGRSMLRTLVVWLVAMIIIVVVVGVVLAATA